MAGSPALCSVRALLGPSRRIGLALIAVALIASPPRPLPGQAQSGGAPSVAEAEAMEARLRAAIQIDPSVASLYGSLGDLMRSQARVEDARNAYAEAVRLEPMNVEYRASLARAHLDLNEFDQAEAHYAWATELAPERADLYAGLGTALLELNRFEDAERVLATANSLEPSNPMTEALLRSARTGARQEDVLEPGTFSPTAAVVSALTWFFRVAMVVAGVGLLLPLAASLFVLVFYLPVALFQRRNRSA